MVAQEFLELLKSPDPEAPPWESLIQEISGGVQKSVCHKAKLLGTSV